MRARKSRRRSTGIVIVSGVVMLARSDHARLSVTRTSAQGGNGACDHASSKLKVVHAHGFVGIVTAVLIAHEDHDRGNARGRKDRGIMPGAARHVNVGHVQLGRSGGKAREKVAI